MRDLDSIQRVELIRALCSGKRVLHLGCTNFPYTEDALRADMLLHSDLERVAADIWGLDADQAGIDILKARGFDQILKGDLENLDDCEIPASGFDIIIAGEIIEHLNDPGLFLTGIRRFMTARTRLVVTTVNAYCGFRFFYYGLRGRRGIAEPVHPDHVAYYSYSTLRLLLQRHGFDIENFYFYDLGSEHRSTTPWYLKAVNNLCVSIAPQWSDGLVAVCTLSADSTLSPITAAKS